MYVVEAGTGSSAAFSLSGRSIISSLALACGPSEGVTDSYIICHDQQPILGSVRFPAFGVA